MQNKYSFLAILVVIILVLSSFITLTQGLSDATSYRSASRIIADYDALEAQYPSIIDHLTVGYTVLGKPLTIYIIGNPQGAPVYVDAAIHGMELISAEALYYAVEKTVTSDPYSILDKTCLIILPIVNLDSYKVAYPEGRYNAHGVDLNRQFPINWELTSTSGPYPLSEPEAQTVDYIQKTFQPIWYLTLHSGWQRVTPARSGTTAEKNYCRVIYNNYDSLLGSMGYSQQLPWSTESSTGIPYAVENGYLNGAHSFEVELSKNHQPSYSSARTLYASHVLALTTVMARDAIDHYSMPNPTPSPAPTATPTATATPTDSPTPEPTESPTAPPTPTPSPAATPSPTPSPTPTPSEMTAQEWQSFWNWLKNQHQRTSSSNWDNKLDDLLSYWLTKVR
jgi:cell division septation protein DedD